jgi:chromosome partitioning protein
MALIVCVLNLKGGVGKTTTAVALAEAASLGARTLLIDADSMGSAYRWSQLAAESGQALRSTIVPMPAGEMARRIGTASRGYAAVVIDAPPPQQHALTIAGEVIASADLVLIPTPAEYASLDRVPATFKSAGDHGKPALAVLTMVRAGLPENQAARDALAGWGIAVASTECPLTVSVQRNYGMPVTGVLARFGLDLLAEILDTIGVNANAQE